MTNSQLLFRDRLQFTYYIITREGRGFSAYKIITIDYGGGELVLN